MARKMKDSGVAWIGEIPAEWKAEKVKHIADSISKGYGITKEDVLENGDIQCVRYGEIYSKYDGSFVSAISRTDENAIAAPKHIFSGDILFAGTGELVEEIGKNIVYMGNEPCLAGGDIIVMNHSQNPIFLNYALNSNPSQAQKSSGKAKLKVVHISSSDIGNVVLALPSLSEQRRIAAFLDAECARIDAVIKQTRASIEEYKKLKQSVITEAVTKGIRSGRKMKDSGIEWIGEISCSFSIQKIKHFISDYKAGPFGSALITGNLLENGNILVYTPEHVTKQSDNIANNLFLPENRREEMIQFFVEAGHIVFPIVGSLGKAMYITQEMREGIINQRLAKFKINENVVDKDYFMYVFAKGDFYKQFLDVNSRGAIIVNLTKEIVYNMPFPVPSLAEQREIVSYLNMKTAEIQSVIAKKEQVLGELESYKKSLIFEYVTGKKEAVL